MSPGRGAPASPGGRRPRIRAGYKKDVRPCATVRLLHMRLRRVHVPSATALFPRAEFGGRPVPRVPALFGVSGVSGSRSSQAPRLTFVRQRADAIAGHAATEAAPVDRLD